MAELDNYRIDKDEETIENIERLQVWSPGVDWSKPVPYDKLYPALSKVFPDNDWEGVIDVCCTAKEKVTDSKHRTLKEKL